MRKLILACCIFLSFAEFGYASKDDWRELDLSGTLCGPDTPKPLVYYGIVHDRLRLVLMGKKSFVEFIIWYEKFMESNSLTPWTDVAEKVYWGCFGDLIS